jgi:Leucine-rich repeat (LRR) protein
VAHLPQNLEELYLNGNFINEVSLSPHKQYEKMIHLGLSMNNIRMPALSTIVKVFPNLFCLDASFNDLCDLESALVWIK